MGTSIECGGGPERPKPANMRFLVLTRPTYILQPKDGMRDGRFFEGHPQKVAGAIVFSRGGRDNYFVRFVFYTMCYTHLLNLDNLVDIVFKLLFVTTFHMNPLVPEPSL